MRRDHRWAAVLVGLCLLGGSGCAPQSTGTVAQANVPPLPPGQARVWVLRQANPQGGNVNAADPAVFVNDASLG